MSAPVAHSGLFLCICSSSARCLRIRRRLAAAWISARKHSFLHIRNKLGTRAPQLRFPSAYRITGEQSTKSIGVPLHSGSQFRRFIFSPASYALKPDAGEEAANRQHHDQQRTDGELWAAHDGYESDVLIKYSTKVMSATSPNTTKARPQDGSHRPATRKVPAAVAMRVVKANSLVKLN